MPEDSAADRSDEAQAPRKRLSSDQRRQEFISKAIRLFAEEGFESSTRELARRLGVTQPLLYRYFPSKQDLITEVYETVYLRRWRPEWEAMIADRSLPIEERLCQFYDAYTDVVFQRDWMRIFLFSGLKGVDINRRYLGRVRERILVPIVRECRQAAGCAVLDPSEEEITCAWVAHGGIYYQGIRTMIYEAGPLERKPLMIRAAVRGLIGELETLRKAG